MYMHFFCRGCIFFKKICKIILQIQKKALPLHQKINKFYSMKKINTTAAAKTAKSLLNTAVKQESNSPRGLVRTLIALCEGSTPAAAAKAATAAKAALDAAAVELRAARKARNSTTEGTSEHAAAVMAVQAAETKHAAAAAAAKKAAQTEQAHIVCAAIGVTSKSNKEAKTAAARKLIDMLPLYTLDELDAVKPAKLTGCKDEPGTFKAYRASWLDAVGEIAAAIELHDVVRKNVDRIAAVRAEQKKITDVKLSACTDDAARARVAKQRAESERIKINKAKDAARADIAAARKSPLTGRQQVTAGVYYTVDVRGVLTPREAVEEAATATA